MTIKGIVFCLLVILAIAYCIYVVWSFADSKKLKVVTILIGVITSAAVFGGAFWYYQNTASGQRAVVNQKSDLGDGLVRTITVYTADGKVITQYTGKIDIKGDGGGYVLFDYDGKRYAYYNCFIESIADIE